MSVHTALIETKRILVVDGWTRKAYRRGNRRCIYGAFNKACINLEEEGIEWKMERVVEKIIGEDVIEWNDKQISKKPVLEALDKAIEATK